MLKSLSPLDGRYQPLTSVLSDYFSEYALIKYRVFVELRYFRALVELPIPPLDEISKEELLHLDNIYNEFNQTEAEIIKTTEKVTNHDVKAVEYYLKNKLEFIGLTKYKEFVHFGLTSQDINNTAFPLMIKNGISDVIYPLILTLISDLKSKASAYKGIPMLARTHGQPASPTTLGKEIAVFIERLEDELELLNLLKYKCKFGGATGNFNAHKVSYPNIDWPSFADKFIQRLGLKRSKNTTQIAHYDDLGAIFHSFIRINTILIDLCRDIWTYVSMDYFKQKVKEGEIGSSAMPHKVNPIDFENAEGNLGLSNSIFSHLAEKLPISRLQRDLSDSTVIRNAGVPFGHCLIAYKSIIKGMDKLLLNPSKLDEDLNNNWSVVAEAIQTILRRELYKEPYEALKDLTRGKTNIAQKDIHDFIEKLDVSDTIKTELKLITPQNYVGYF